MAKNPYFKYRGSEQSLVNDLTIEAIKIHGQDMVYIPRTYVDIDQLFGEDVLSKFEEGNYIEMYIDSYDGFEGEGDFIAKFGLEIRDSITLVVSKQRFEQTMSHDSNITRPREGDLIYFPLSKSIFEIKFVEHENPFYQVGNLYTYKLSCDLFRYSHEEINTDFSDIDSAEDERKEYADEFTLGSQLTATATFYEGEIVYQVSGQNGGLSADATATATVIEWTPATSILTVASGTGTFNSGGLSDSVIGQSSGAEYTLSSIAGTTMIVPNLNIDSPQGDNDDIQLEADRDSIIDFSENDPFSLGNF
jgi:hypothetical protein